MDAFGKTFSWFGLLMALSCVFLPLINNYAVSFKFESIRHAELLNGDLLFSLKFKVLRTRVECGCWTNDGRGHHYDDCERCDASISEISTTTGSSCGALHVLVRRQSTSRENTFPPTNEFWKSKKNKQREQKDSEINYCTLVPLFSSNSINFAMKAHIREVHVFISHNERKRQSVCKRNSPLIFSLNRIL